MNRAFGPTYGLMILANAVGIPVGRLGELDGGVEWRADLVHIELQGRTGFLRPLIEESILGLVEQDVTAGGEPRKSPARRP